MLKTFVHLTLIALLFAHAGCSESTPAEAMATTSEYVKEIYDLRAEKHEEFLDKEQSPLAEEDVAGFEGLNYFDIDEGMRITATFKHTPDESPFQMKTTTDRLPEYVKYGEASFKLGDQDFMLTVYQNIELVKKPEYTDHLFVPFTDLTSGEESYGGGRYMDVTVPEGNEIVLDFNKCYNPYCSYNDRYSCPIPPAENFVDFKIEAGEKKYKDDH